MVRGRDPRPMLSQEINKQLKKTGKKDLGQLSNKDSEPYIVLAKSALLFSSDFEEFVQRLPSEGAQLARNFREDWHFVLEQFEQLKAQIAKYADLAPIYVKERALLQSGDDLLSFVKTLDRDGWHRFICDCDWEEEEASDILPATAWILSQPECDRWTGVAFLASAQASMIDDGDREHLNPILARETMAAVSDRLRDGFYQTSEFVLISNARDDVELARTGANAAKSWRFPFHWDRVGELGTVKPQTSIEVCRNRPVKSFEAWLSDTGRDI